MSTLALFAVGLLALIAAVPIGAALWAVGAQMLDAAAWQAVMLRGMAQDLSWTGPARDYLDLYGEARTARMASPRLVRV